MIKKEFENRLNKLYTHPLLGDLLDSGEIDFAVLDILNELALVFTKTPHNILNPAVKEETLLNLSDATRPLGRLYQALLDLNILYKSKHYDLLYVEHSMYVKHVLKPYVDNLFA